MSHTEPLYIPVSNGVQLAATSFGGAGRPAVVLMHGAGQTRHSWRNAGKRLAAAGWNAIAVDARGHGNSDWSMDGDYAVDTLINDLTAVANHFRTSQKPVLVGASLGGICGLLAEGESVGQIFQALVLVDITPRTDQAGVTRIIEFMTRYQSGFASIDEAAMAVGAFQSENRQARDRHNETSSRPSDGLKKNLRLADDGRYYWHWDPRLMDHIGTVNDELYRRQLNAASQLKLPVLLVRGQQSDVVSMDAVTEFLDLVPHAKFQDIADAAHMVAGDNNDIFASAVLEFIGDANTGNL